jgi:predicted ATP-dependent endonuclease of OLD family
MYVKQLIIVNYKSCQYLELELDKDIPNIFIGINDCGKSSILNSIGLILEERPKFNFEKDDNKRNDISFAPLGSEELAQKLEKFNLPLPPDYVSTVDGSEEMIDKTVVIGLLILEEIDFEKIEDNKLSNHMLWVLDNAVDNECWLARVFDGRSSGIEDFLLTLDKDGDPLGLFNEVQKKLQQFRDEYGVTTEDIQNENRKGPFKNIEVVRAIYNKMNLSKGWSTYNRRSDRWLFPIYRYLDWNFSYKQLEDYTNELIKTKIEKELESARKFARRQSARAQSIVNEELAKIADEVTSDIPYVNALEAHINFDVDSRITDYLVRKKYSTQAVHIENQGEGLKRQIWFGLLRWKAKEDSNSKKLGKQFIWCFDEPETHLYPKAQREFFDLIKKISEQNIQTILSTHSSIFVDKAKLSSINKVELNDRGISFYSKCQTVEDIFSSLKLRNSDFLFYDKFLVVEGDTEEYLIPKLYQLYKKRKLDEDHIQLVNLKGKDKIAQNKQVLEEMLRDFRKSDERVVYIFDNDASFKFTQKQRAESVNMFFIGRQDIEDSFCPSVWKAIVEEKYGDKIQVALDEIIQIRESIPNDREEKNSNNKFYKKLQQELRKKLSRIDPETDYNYALLPDKGSDSADLISRHVTDIAKIDARLLAAFDAL